MLFILNALKLLLGELENHERLSWQTSDRTES